MQWLSPFWVLLQSAMVIAHLGLLQNAMAVALFSYAAERNAYRLSVGRGRMEWLSHPWTLLQNGMVTTISRVFMCLSAAHLCSCMFGSWHSRLLVAVMSVREGRLRL